MGHRLYPGFLQSPQESPLSSSSASDEIKGIGSGDGPRSKRLALRADSGFLGSAGLGAPSAGFFVSAGNGSVLGGAVFAVTFERASTFAALPAAAICSLAVSSVLLSSRWAPTNWTSAEGSWVSRSSAVPATLMGVVSALFSLSLSLRGNYVDADGLILQTRQDHDDGPLPEQRAQFFEHGYTFL